MPSPLPLRAARRRKQGFTAVGQLTPGRAPYGTSLALGSALHRQTSTRRPLAHDLGSAGALVSSMRGSLRQGPQRTSTSCSAPMPGAPMEPRPNGRGNSRTAWSAPRSWPSFNGAPTKRSGKRQAVAPRERASTRFNGAPTKRSGKRSLPTSGAWSSTRCLSSSRGRLPSPSSHRTGLVDLTSGSSGHWGPRNSIPVFQRRWFPIRSYLRSSVSWGAIGMTNRKAGDGPGP